MFANLINSDSFPTGSFAFTLSVAITAIASIANDDSGLKGESKLMILQGLSLVEIALYTLILISFFLIPGLYLRGFSSKRKLKADEEKEDSGET